MSPLSFVSPQSISATMLRFASFLQFLSISPAAGATGNAERVRYLSPSRRLHDDRRMRRKILERSSPMGTSDCWSTSLVDRHVRAAPRSSPAGSAKQELGENRPELLEGMTGNRDIEFVPEPLSVASWVKALETSTLNDRSSFGIYARSWFGSLPPSESQARNRDLFSFAFGKHANIRAR